MSYEATSGIRVREDGGSENADKAADSGDIFKSELTGLVNGLEVECERRLKRTTQFLGFAIYQDREGYGKNGGKSGTLFQLCLRWL